MISVYFVDDDVVVVFSLAVVVIFLVIYENGLFFKVDYPILMFFMFFLCFEIVLLYTTFKKKLL